MKLYSNCFSMFYLEFLIYFLTRNQIEKKILNKKKRNKNQKSIIYKTIQSKNCRETWRFSIQRRAGRVCSACCEVGGVSGSEKPG